MDHGKRIEQALTAAVARITADRCPPKLAAALQYSMFPGGARVRPRLCLAVAAACGDEAEWDEDEGFRASDGRPSGARRDGRGDGR